MNKADKNVQATKTDAEREYYTERKLKIRELKKQEHLARNEKTLKYSDLARRISEHPELQNITNSEEYKKISDRLLNDALTQDIFSEEYLNKNNSTIKTNNSNLDNNLIDSDFSTKNIKINYGDNESVIMTPEQRASYVKKHKDWLEIHKDYLSKSELEKYKSDLKNFENLKPGTELTITSRNYNDNRLSFYNDYLGIPVKSKSDKKSKKENDLDSIFQTEIGNDYYGGKSFDSELDGKHILYTKEQKLRLVREVLKELHPELTDVDSLPEQELMQKIAQLGYDYNLILRYLYSKPTTSTEPSLQDPFDFTPDVNGLYDGYELIENGDIFKKYGFHLIRSKKDGKIHLASIQKDGNGKYKPIQDIYTNPDQYDSRFIKNGIMLFTDANGDYQLGKIGDEGYRDIDHQAIMDYLNTWRDKMSTHKYTIGNQGNYNYALENLFQGRNGNVTWGDVTYMLPRFEGLEGYRALITDTSTVGDQGSFNDTPIILYNPETKDQKLIKVTSLDNNKVLITDSEGNSKEYDIPHYTNNDIDYSWYEKYNDFINENPFEDKNRQFLPGITDNYITERGNLYDSGAFEKGWNSQDANTNDPLYYALNDEAIKTIINNVFEYLDTDDLDDEDWIKYANFARLVIDKAGGINKLRQLGYRAYDIIRLQNILSNFLLTPKVQMQKNGGVLKAAKGTNLNLLDTKENINLRDTEYLNNLQLKQNQILNLPEIEKVTRVGGNSRDSKEWDWHDTADAAVIGADTIAAVGSFIPLAGPAVSLVSGLVGTTIQLVSDLTDEDSEDGEAWKNLGVNLAFTALGMIPGVKALKLAKGAAKARKIIKSTELAVKGASKAGKGVNKALLSKATKALNESEKVIKNQGLIEDTFRKIGDGSKKVFNVVGKYGYPVLLVGNVINTGAYIGSAINDVADGKGIKLEDFRAIPGMVSMVGGAKQALHNYAVKRITTPVELGKKSISNSPIDKNKISVRMSNKNNDMQIELEVTPGMKKEDINRAATDELKRMKNQTNNSISALISKQNSGVELTAEELNELAELQTNLEKYEDLLKVPRGFKERRNGLKINYDKSEFKNLSKLILTDDDGSITAQMIKSKQQLKEEGFGIFEKYAERIAKKYGYVQVTPSLNNQLEILSSKKYNDPINLKEIFKLNNSDPNKYKNYNTPLRLPKINKYVNQAYPNMDKEGLDPILNINRILNKNNKQFFMKLGGIALKIYKYDKGSNVVKTYGDLVLTIKNWRDQYNMDLITYFLQLAEEGKLTPEKIEQFNKLFNDYNSLNGNIKYDPSAKRSIYDQSGLTRQYQNDYEGLGLHLNSFKQGWKNGYESPSLDTAETFDPNKPFKADDLYGNKTYNRLANLWTDAELVNANKALEGIGYQWTLLDPNSTSDANGRKLYKITKITPDADPSKEDLPEVDTISPKEELDEIDTTTDLEEENLRKNRIDWTPLKVGADALAQYFHNKRQLKLAHVDPFYKNYVNLNSKVTDNYTAQLSADRAKGDLNTLADNLASNLSDIDKINAILMEATKNGTDLDVDTAFKRDEEYNKTTAFQEDLKRNEHLTNSGVNEENRKSDYQSKLIDKQNQMAANESMYTTIKDGINRVLKSRESNMLADLSDYNTNLQYDLEYKKSMAKQKLYDKYANMSKKEEENLINSYNTYLKEFKNNPANTGKNPLSFDQAINPETGNTYQQDLDNFTESIDRHYNEEYYQIEAGFGKKYVRSRRPFVNVFTTYTGNPTYAKKGGNLTFKERKELIKIKSGYDILKQQTQDIQKTLDRNEDALARIMSSLSKERLLILKNMIK